MDDTIIAGPENHEAWKQCGAVFRAAVLMCGAASPSALDAYANVIEYLVQRHPGHWGAIMIADETMRAEPWELVLEEALEDFPSGFDPSFPWEWILKSTAFGNVAHSLEAASGRDTASRRQSARG